MSEYVDPLNGTAPTDLTCQYCGEPMELIFSAPEDGSRGNIMACTSCRAGCQAVIGQAWDWRPPSNAHRLALLRERKEWRTRR